MLDSLETKLLIQFGYGARHLASGHLVFARGGSLLAVPFHQDRLEVAGEPVPVVNDVRMESLTGHVQFTVSGNGTLAYVPGEDEGVGKIAWVDRSGGVEFLSVPEQAYGAPNIAPDGQRVAVDVADVNDYIWIYDFERQEGRRLTTGKFPVWSPDGDAIAFSAVQPGGQWKMLVQPVDRVERPRELWTTGGMAAATTWSPDERTIGVYQEANTNSIGFLAAEGGRDVETVPKQSGVHLFPAFSPDGCYVAYTSTETGGFEIWVRSFPDGQTVKQVSVNGGTEVVWCENGELFFRAGNQWMVVAMTTEPELTWDPPRPLFKTDFIDTPALSFDVSPDGQRILLFKRTREAERKKLHLVVNWFEELKQLVPTDN